MSNLREIDDGFDAFWRAYPRRVSKAAARLAWQRTRGQRPPMAALLQAIARMVEWRRQLEAARQFVPALPYPATWLNGERWADEFDSLSGVPELAAPAPPSDEQLRDRRIAELARDCWMQIRVSVLGNGQRPLLGWGHAAADSVLQTMGGLEALAKHRQHMPRAEMVFLQRMAEALAVVEEGGTVVAINRRRA